MIQTKSLLPFALFIFASLITVIACADDDVLVCNAEVVYEGRTYQVREDAHSLNHAKHEVIEEACDRACDHLDDWSESKCERACRTVATIQAIECVDKFRAQKPETMPAQANVQPAAPAPALAHQLCTAEVTYKGSTYPITEDVKSHEDPQREVIEEACDKICDHWSDLQEKTCERACNAEAVANNLKCS